MPRMAFLLKDVKEYDSYFLKRRLEPMVIKVKAIENPKIDDKCWKIYAKAKSKQICGELSGSDCVNHEPRNVFIWFYPYKRQEKLDTDETFASHYVGSIIDLIKKLFGSIEGEIETEVGCFDDELESTYFTTTQPVSVDTFTKFFKELERLDAEYSKRRKLLLKRAQTIKQLQKLDSILNNN